MCFSLTAAEEAEEPGNATSKAPVLRPPPSRTPSPTPNTTASRPSQRRRRLQQDTESLPDTTPNAVPPKKARRARLSDPDTETNNALRSYIEERRQALATAGRTAEKPSPDADEMFLLSCLPVLKAIPPHLFFEARVAVLTALRGVMARANMWQAHPSQGRTHPSDIRPQPSAFQPHTSQQQWQEGDWDNDPYEPGLGLWMSNLEEL